ncbi:hypothetical protein O1611_g1832 [Lasiodiplodia mahajangana]|uniref:Uncharacterized protein n=1 Tax=Lasiodiplodia mahajangana TaxID=1108764 RepID=A0ACC2JWA0_9PEZI|nr:hypothetical protein O1611_g1832 [Lasiodiplodia mahajangana]
MKFILTPGQSETVMAGTHVAGLPELLIMISEQTDSRKLLHDACLVNRTFNNAFTPSLYRCLRWDDRNIGFLCDNAKRRHLIDSGKLSYTKTIILAGSAVRSMTDTWQSIKSELFDPWDAKSIVWVQREIEAVFVRLNRALVDFCQAAERLRNFACQDIALSVECVHTLSSAAGLQSLCIQFPYDNNEFLTWFPRKRRTKMFHAPQKRFQFRGLKKLSMIGLYGDLKAWGQHIGRIMVDSPKLEQLLLSVEEEKCNDQIFDEIGSIYFEHVGVLPSLQRLRLEPGCRVFVDLDHLMDSSNFRDAHIYNRRHRECVDILSPMISLNSALLSTLDIECSTWFANNGIVRPQAEGNDRPGDVYSNLVPYELLQSLGAQNVVRVKFPMTALWEMHVRQPLELLEACSCIKDLAIEWGNAMPGVTRSETKPQFEAQLGHVCKILSNMLALENLWIVSTACWIDSEIDVDLYLYPYAKQAAETQESLKYIRVRSKAWRVHRNARPEGVLLEALEEWEDEAEGS